MQFSLGLPFMDHPHRDQFLSSSSIAAVAKAAEDAGFGAVFLTEHPIPGDKWLETGGHDALDPFVGLAFAAAATSKIRLMTNLTPLPFRNPFLLAKSVATLDRLSGGRVTLGVGTGYLKSEFFALGVDFEERNLLFDESLTVMRKVWTGESVTHEGLHFSARESTALPRPAQEDLPIWIGGNSKLSRRRVAEGAGGWMPMPNPRSVAARRRSAPLETIDDLVNMLEYMWAHAEEVGRTTPIEVMYMCFDGGVPSTSGWDPAALLDGVQAQAEVGVTWQAVNAAGETLDEVLSMIEAYEREVIGPMG